MGHEFTITLSSERSLVFSEPVTGQKVITEFDPKYEKSALAVRVNGEIKDLSVIIDQDADIEVITSDKPEALDLIRHSASHVMAQAVQELFPGTQVTLGPTIENGFYYDFAREEPFRPDDLKVIEEKMQEIVDRDIPVEREVWTREEAIAKFAEMGEKYKVEIIQDLPSDVTITVYRQGDWFDLCRGPHIPRTGKLGKAFKLTRVAGAYWRGDSNREMLQRIYGTAWGNRQQLKEYLTLLEEAEKRDHRKLGREMDLFHMQDQAPGAVFWHDRGWRLFRRLVEYLRKRQERAGYMEVSTPTVMDRSLWEQSGHWEKFGEDMYTSQTADERVFALKPMNCPGGIQVFRQGIVSYRDLPRKIAEFGRVHRYEASGALHGLLRVREFTQDDAHIFCTPEQMEGECQKVVDLLMDIYKVFGFDQIKIKFADRPEKRIGSDELWDHVEKALTDALDHMGYTYTTNPGEGTFYGPKMEFVLRDAIGREWQCGTLQVDMNLPERFSLHYVDESGEKQRPIMLHRALFGSLERFLGILIEHYTGKFPFWLAPQQIVVTTISAGFEEYANEVAEKCRESGLTCEVDLRNEKISYKVREHSHKKIPVILVIGKEEASGRKVTIRRLGEKEQKVLPLDDAIALLYKEAIPPGFQAPL